MLNFQKTSFYGASPDDRSWFSKSLATINLQIIRHFLAVHILLLQDHLSTAVIKTVGKNPQNTHLEVSFLSKDCNFKLDDTGFVTIIHSKLSMEMWPPFRCLRSCVTLWSQLVSPRFHCRMIKFSYDNNETFSVNVDGWYIFSIFTRVLTRNKH